MEKPPRAIRAFKAAGFFPDRKVARWGNQQEERSRFLISSRITNQCHHLMLRRVRIRSQINNSQEDYILIRPPAEPILQERIHRAGRIHRAALRRGRIQRIHRGLPIHLVVPIRREPILQVGYTPLGLRINLVRQHTRQELHILQAEVGVTALIQLQIALKLAEPGILRRITAKCQEARRRVRVALLKLVPLANTGTGRHA